LHVVTACACAPLLTTHPLNSGSSREGCTFYEGNVVHVRTYPAEHRFKYGVRLASRAIKSPRPRWLTACHQVRYALVDLDSPPKWFTRLQARSTHSALPVVTETEPTSAGVRASSRSPLHPNCCLQPDCMTAQQARAIAGTAGPVWFLSFPPSMGYDQNPIAVYYCYGPGAVVWLLRYFLSAAACAARHLRVLLAEADQCGSSPQGPQDRVMYQRFAWQP
jgi:DUF1365 family protein